MKKSSILGYITGFGIGLASLIPGTIKDKASIDDVVAQLQPQNSQEQVNETNYKPDSVIEYAKNVVGPSNAYAGNLGSIEEATALLIEGDQLRKNDNCEKAIKKLSKSVNMYQSHEEELTLDEFGNYGAALVSLADCYVHDTLEANFVENDALPNSLERLKKGRKYAEESLEKFELYSQQGKEKANEGKIFESWAYNLLGMSTKYLDGPASAKKFYKQAMDLNPNNEDAAYNLEHVWDNHNAFR
jgi:tetratricopeptide (TPR) repeat protein